MLATTSPKIVGENLRRLIEESGRTQEQFAVDVFADVTTVRRWMRNGIDAISTVLTVADVLGVDVTARLF